MMGKQNILYYGAALHIISYEYIYYYSSNNDRKYEFNFVFISRTCNGEINLKHRKKRQADDRNGIIEGINTNTIRQLRIVSLDDSHNPVDKASSMEMTQGEYDVQIKGVWMRYYFNVVRFLIKH